MIVKTKQKISRVKQILFVSFCSAIAFAQTDKRNYKNDLAGAVKSVRITTYNAVDKGRGHYGKGSVVKGMDNFLTRYDKKGNIIEQIAYYTNGTLWYTKKYAYEGNDIPKPTTAKTAPIKENKPAMNIEKGEEGFRGRVTYRYDKKGQKTEESSFDQKGVLLWRYVYRYDNRGNVIERDSFDPQPTLLSRESHRYDANNNILEKIITMKNQTAYRCTWKYDEKGKVLEKEEYFTELITPDKIDKIVEDEINMKGVLSKRFQYTYDNKGNRIEVQIYDAQKKETPIIASSGGGQAPEVENIPKEAPKEILNPKLLYTDEYDNMGNLWKKDNYIYAKDGKIIEVKSIDNEGKSLFRYTYKYDDRGNEIEKISYNKDNEVIQKTTQIFDMNNYLVERAEYDTYNELIQRNSYKYDTKGNMVEQQGHNSNGSLAFTIKFTYNAMGGVVERQTFSPKGELTFKFAQQFKVDAHKNWTKATQYSNGKATYITERIIEYYDK